MSSKMRRPMRALIHDPDLPHGLRLGEAPDPRPGPSELLVQLAATSLNFGEVAFLRDHVGAGDVAGWDGAGTVLTPAADGSGPPAGSRVVTFGWAGAWGELRAVDSGELAVLPDGVDFGSAAALPVAGVTALRAVRRLGSVVGRRVLITGASGGVGRFAVQLAARAGANVVASVGSTARAEGLVELGAREIVTDIADVAVPVDFAIDNVGGRLLAELLTHVNPGGSVMSVGMASLEPTTIDFERLRNQVAGVRIEAFVVGPGFGTDLAYLVSLIESGELEVEIGWRGSWDRVDEAVAALLGRRVRGKAVLEVSQ
jgi:NADPH2:quinone reductase